MSLIPAGWRTTVWTETTTNFLQVELCPEFVRRAAGAANDVELPCLFSFDDPVCRELSQSMVAEAQAHGPAARMYVESAAVVLVATAAVAEAAGRWRRRRGRGCHRASCAAPRSSSTTR